MRSDLPIVKYQQAAHHLMAQAFEELAEGDTRQASEKGWGAAAQMLKAVAEHRGWEHKTHADVYKVINKIVTETRQDQILDWGVIANDLHKNFYEDSSSPEFVAGGLRDISKLIDHLEPLLET
ncbi:MAG: hypothetical protein F4Y75_04575 [Acidimicrobiia bacterium]|nr:hypothetical protein [Acidimicrobiia bacterium]MYD04185.1 hypothetical protein [Acidimicrobiia bacterium]MYF26622.1 hypothetical protein [Acidimicrobiia bacterium]